MEDLSKAINHSHDFSPHFNLRGEKRTLWVIAITIVTMLIELIAGKIYGSMALLADGWHMGTHAAALAITLYSYAFARKNANNPKYSFGTGKVNSLGGFASAISLAIVALIMMVECIARFSEPYEIRFTEAIIVASIGLVVNLVSAALLMQSSTHHHGHNHDPNLYGAYLHVMADALTSLLAIAALLAGQQLNWTWMDPAIGIVGSIIIIKWSFSLLKETSAVLLDSEISEQKRKEIVSALENNTDKVTDLHLWRIGQEHVAAVIAIKTSNPQPPVSYKEKIAQTINLSHVTIEVNY